MTAPDSSDATGDADNSGDAESDHRLATRLARETGIQLVGLREQMFGAGANPWDVMDRGDVVGSRFISAELGLHRPGDAVLDEEKPDDPTRHHAARCWIIDPLDGTREFGEPGRSDWAVHVALWDDDRLAAGAVALPALDMVLSTEDPPVVPASDRTRPRLVTSRYRAPYAAAIAANALEADAIRLGSAGAKAMAVVLGHADIYLHDGGMFQWDSAAPVAVAQAAGLHTSRIDGSPIVYNEPSPWLPDLLICRPEFAEPILRALWG